MELRIDAAGRIVIPKAVRERLGFSPHVELEAVEQSEGVLIRRAEARPAWIVRDGMLVHQGRAESGADLTRIVDEVREERIRDILQSFYDSPPEK